MSVLNYSVPEIASFYRRMATMGAHALPEEVSCLLPQVWIADTRGESFEVRSEIGSLQVADAQRHWVWGNRDLLAGQVAETKAMEITEKGAVRAGGFVRWHPGKSEQGLLMYSEGLPGSTKPEESRPIMYAVKSTAGWRSKP